MLVAVSVALDYCGVHRRPADYAKQSSFAKALRWVLGMLTSEVASMLWEPAGHQARVES